MHAMLTTDVANYNVTEDQLSQAHSDALEFNKHHLQIWNNRGERIQSIGDSSVVPRIWTHTPVPMGLDVIALKQRFEERAAYVLGDHDSPADLTKCSSPDDLYNDNRYWSVTVRAAWMMYVDQAIEHFNSK